MQVWSLGRWLLPVLAASYLGCSVNVLTNFSNQKTNEAYFTDAERMIDAGEYADALDIIAKMDADFLATDRVKELKASAYGGLCGLDFLDFASALEDIGSTRLFPFLVETFKAGTTAKEDFCILAEEQITSIGVAADRTKNQNVFMALLELVKIGNILAHYTDANNDGTSDAAYNACTVGGGTRVAGALDDSDVRQIGTGLTIAMASLQAAGGGSSSTEDSLSDLTGACDLLTGPLAAYNFCSVTDADDFTATHLKGIRSFLKESTAIGLGTNCTGNISTCNCP